MNSLQVLSTLTLGAALPTHISDFLKIVVFVGLGIMLVMLLLMQDFKKKYLSDNNEISFSNFTFPLLRMTLVGAAFLLLSVLNISVTKELFEVDMDIYISFLILIYCVWTAFPSIISNIRFWRLSKEERQKVEPFTLYKEYVQSKRDYWSDYVKQK